MEDRIKIYRRIAAGTDRVFTALTRSEDLVNWYSAGGGWSTPYAESDPVVGGNLRIGFADPEGKVAFDLTGTYDELETPRLVEYTLEDGRKVRIRVEPDGAETEVFWEFDQEQEFPFEAQRAGWQAILDNLGRYLEKEADSGSIDGSL